MFAFFDELCVVVRDGFAVVYDLSDVEFEQARRVCDKALIQFFVVVYSLIRLV